jgi:hypothetical protein
VPRQVMIQKAQEFRTMAQGTMRVEEYECHFTKMMRYAPDDTNTEEKKQFWFLRGLHHGIRQIVMGCEYPSFRSLVNCAITVERERIGLEDRQRNKKRKADHQVRDRPFQKARNAPVSRTGTTVGDATTTPATRPTEGRTREEATTTASSRHRGPTVARRCLFASLATNRATSPTSAPRRRPRLRLARLAPPAGPLRLHAPQTVAASPT